MAQRKSPVARAGNYAAEMDTFGLDPEMKATLLGTPMDKVESAYVSGKGGSESAREAVRRARKANRKPPVRE